MGLVVLNLGNLPPYLAIFLGHCRRRSLPTFIVGFLSSSAKHFLSSIIPYLLYFSLFFLSIISIFYMRNLIASGSCDSFSSLVLYSSVLVLFLPFLRFCSLLLYFLTSVSNLLTHLVFNPSFLKSLFSHFACLYIRMISLGEY